ncbi:unnamed protein product [Closterium sp. NIES-54]
MAGTLSMHVPVVAAAVPAAGLPQPVAHSLRRAALVPLRVRQTVTLAAQAKRGAVVAPRNVAMADSLTAEEEGAARQSYPAGVHRYEAMVVLRPDLTEDERVALTERYEEVRRRGGTMRRGASQGRNDATRCVAVARLCAHCAAPVSPSRPGPLSILRFYKPSCAVHDCAELLASLPSPLPSATIFPLTLPRVCAPLSCALRSCALPACALAVCALPAFSRPSGTHLSCILPPLRSPSPFSPSHFPRVQFLVAGGALDVEIFNRGMQPLAYSIKTKNMGGVMSRYLDGIFFLFIFAARSEAQVNLQQRLNRDDDVIRSTTFRLKA